MVASLPGSALETSPGGRPPGAIYQVIRKGHMDTQTSYRRRCIIFSVFEPAERPRAIGLWATAVGLGIATGPVLGGLLLDHFWWGSVFLINVPVTVLGAIAVAILVPESRNREAGGIDYVGVLLSIAGLVTLVYGIVQGGDGVSWLSLGVLGPIVGRPVILAGL